MELKAILADDKELFTYEKAFMGSYRDFVPNHYKYGYQMVEYARDEYGQGIFDSLINYTAQHPYLLYPFALGLKKYSGSSKSGLYRETLYSLSDHWQQQANARTITESIARNNTSKKHYTNYRFPQYLENGDVFAEKSGIDQITEFVRIDSNGEEKRIYRPGFSDQARISVEGEYIAWTEILTDARWDRRSYSVIKLYNMKTELERVLSWKTRYFSPDLNKDANRLTAIETDDLNRCFLLIIDVRSGRVMQRIPSPENAYLQYPTWNNAQTGIYMTVLGATGKKIVYYDLHSGDWEEIFNGGFENIAELDAGEDFLVFRATFSGIDNIYAIDIKSYECQQVTSCRFGAFMPVLSAKNDKLLFANYTSQGFDIHEMDFNTVLFQPLEQVRDHSEQKYYPSKAEESLVRERSSEPDKAYDIKPFRKYTDLINFHTWLPFYTDIEDPDFKNPEISPGFMLFSQNKLSTATTSLGYEYLDKDHYLHASFTYSGWYPVIRLSYDYGGLPTVTGAPEGINPPNTVKTDMSFNMEVSIPLNLTMNRYIIGMRPSVETSFSRSYFYYSEPAAYKSGLTFMDYRFYIFNYLKTSRRDILPRLGQTFDLRFVNTPFEDEQVGSQIYAAANLYFPGVLRHQTLKIKTSVQKQNVNRFLMSNLVSMPRGFETHSAVRLRKISTDYVFPICYPDINIWHAAYIKRLRGGLFLDHAFGEDVYIREQNNGPVNKHFTSMGAELTTDVHFAHLIFPLNIGVRFIYLPVEKSSMAEMVFSVDLDQF